MSKPKSGGSFFMHVGRTDCPANSSKIYSSLVAGSYYGDSGSGVDLLCPSNQPQIDAVYDSGNDGGARVFRTEYETSDDPFPFKGWSART